ncbi:hypothetical protein KP509_10G084200 [Ceratopteris richardii]|nr:hypothetical protein KP509_10G084200 [Ceratopteris richardii]
MHEITSSDQFYDVLSAAARQDKLVLVDFYSAGCRSCKALHPKICQIAADNPNVEVLTVNFYDNLDFCRSLNVNVLPFFHFYRNNVKIDGFSCSLSKIDKLRAAVARNQQDFPLQALSISSNTDFPKEITISPALAGVGTPA